jgi:chromate transporter
VIVLARRAIIDIPTGMIAAATLGVVFKFKVPEPLIVIAAGLVGLIVFRYGG